MGKYDHLSKEELIQRIERLEADLEKATLTPSASDNELEMRQSQHTINFLNILMDIVSLICSVIILLINVDMFYLYDNLINLFSEKYENDIIEQQNKAYLNQLHLMQESQMKIRFLKHDMKNHIINMQSLLSAEKYDQLKDYLAETNDYIYSNNVIIDSGNETIDSVLNYKLAPLENRIVPTCPSEWPAWNRLRCMSWRDSF